MKPINCLFAASVALVSLPLLPAAAAPATDRSQIQASLDLMNKALIDKNLTELMSCYTSDCSSKQMDGSIITHKQLLQEAPLVFANMTFISAKTTILTFSIKGGKAYVTTKDHDVVSAVNPQTQQSQTATMDDSDSEVWRKVGGKWKQEFSQSTSDHFQPQNPSSGPAGVGV